MINKYFCIQF